MMSFESFFIWDHRPIQIETENWLFIVEQTDVYLLTYSMIFSNVNVELPGMNVMLERYLIRERSIQGEEEEELTWKTLVSDVCALFNGQLRQTNMGMKLSLMSNTARELREMERGWSLTTRCLQGNVGVRMNEKWWFPNEELNSRENNKREFDLRFISLPIQFSHLRIVSLVEWSIPLSLLSWISFFSSFIDHGTKTSTSMSSHPCFVSFHQSIDPLSTRRRKGSLPFCSTLWPPSYRNLRGQDFPPSEVLITFRQVTDRMISKALALQQRTIFSQCRYQMTPGLDDWQSALVFTPRANE